MVVLAAAVALRTLSGTEFMPELDEGSLLIETRRLPSTSLPQGMAIAADVERTLHAVPRGAQHRHESRPAGARDRRHGLV